MVTAVALALLTGHLITVDARVTASDSSAFWSAARDVEAAIGMSLFRPTMDRTMRHQVYPVDVEIEPRIAASGVTIVTSRTHSCSCASAAG